MRRRRAGLGGGGLTKGPADAFSIRPLRPGDAAALLRVEHRASAVLEAVGLHAVQPPANASDFAAFLDRHTVLVATVENEPVGYVAGRDAGEIYWLGEIGVDPSHARRGIGRALVKAICGEARALFHRAIGLTTYRDVPFNAPFYARCGFLTVSRQPQGSILGERLRLETPAGASIDERTAMIRWL